MGSIHRTARDAIENGLRRENVRELAGARMDVERLTLAWSSARVEEVRVTGESEVEAEGTVMAEVPCAVADGDGKVKMDLRSVTVTVRAQVMDDHGAYELLNATIEVV